MRATAIASASGERGPSSTASSTSPRTMWSIDLVECEARGLDRRVGHDQLLELDLELVEVPLAVLPEAVDGEAQYALFSLAQVLDPHAWGQATEDARIRPQRQR